MKLNKKFDHIVKVDLATNTGFGDDFLKVNPGKLTYFELEIIHQEYQKKERGMEPDWEKIDSIIIRLKFFSKYMKHVRLSLIKNAKFFLYKTGDIVFREGDIGDLLYVILKGSVNVRNRMKNPEGNEEDLLVACIYQGNSFGDIALTGTKKTKELTGDALLMHQIDLLAQKKTYQDIKKALEEKKIPPPKTLINQNLDEKQNLSYNQSTGDHNVEEEKNEPTQIIHKRTSTIEVVESLCCLSIPRENVQTVLVSLIQKELDQKVKVLMCLPFFEVRFIIL